jgi:hypothetical protein
MFLISDIAIIEINKVDFSISHNGVPSQPAAALASSSMRSLFLGLCGISG